VLVDVAAKGRALVFCPCGHIDVAFARSLGLDCRTMKTISVKSTGHFRSGFEPIAGSIYNVDTAGQLSQDFASLPYTRLGRPVYPLDVEAPLGW
jgi:microcystin degradation protein MlrC